MTEHEAAVYDLITYRRLRDARDRGVWDLDYVAARLMGLEHVEIMDAAAQGVFDSDLAYKYRASRAAMSNQATAPTARPRAVPGSPGPPRPRGTGRRGECRGWRPGSSVLLPLATPFGCVLGRFLAALLDDRLN